MADQKSDAENAEEEPAASVIGVGGIPGWLLGVARRIGLPVIALKGRSMYRVMIEGGGFELPLESCDLADGNPTGFFTTRFVAASSRGEAEAMAKALVLREWQGLSLLSQFTGTDEPTLTISESEAVEGWFRRSRGMGFTFFRAGPITCEEPFTTSAPSNAADPARPSGTADAL